MKKIELGTCDVCGGSYRELGDTGERYPVYDAPQPCTCSEAAEDTNETAARITRRTTEGK